MSTSVSISDLIIFTYVICTWSLVNATEIKDDLAIDWTQARLTPEISFQAGSKGFGDRKCGFKSWLSYLPWANGLSSQSTCALIFKARIIIIVAAHHPSQTVVRVKFSHLWKPFTNYISLWNSKLFHRQLGKHHKINKSTYLT